MKLRRIRFNPLHVLTPVILLLTGGLTWMWFDATGNIRNITWTPPKALQPDIKTAANPPTVNGIAANSALFSVILERPIFAPDRRPPPPPAVAPPPDPLANIQVYGIFSGTNAGILASVDGKMRRIKLNEVVGSWALKRIDSRSITFTQGEENRQLQLAYAPLGQRPPPTGQVTTNPTLVTPTIARQSTEDAARDNIRRRNELRASRGLPLITE